MEASSSSDKAHRVGEHRGEGKCCTWEPWLVSEEAVCNELWRSGLLPLGPWLGAPLGRNMKGLRVAGVPCEPWWVTDLGVAALKVRLLKAREDCPAVGMRPQPQ